MKVQIILAACLFAAAFAAPIDNFIDPDCIEEDLKIEEPSQEIEAEFALGVPDLRVNFQNEPEDKYVGDCATEAAPVVTDACVDDPIEPEPTQPPAPAAVTDACVEPLEVEESEPEPTTAYPETEPESDECIETQAPVEDDNCEADYPESNQEAAPAFNMRIEPAAVVEDIKVYGEENNIPDIELCEE